MAELRGAAALALVENVIDALAPHLPAEVVSVKARANHRGGLIIRAMPEGADEDLRMRQTGGRSVPGSQPYPPGSLGEQFGDGPPIAWGATAHYVGTWVPFLPRAVLARINAQSATEGVQEAVESLVRRPWPFADAAVHTRLVRGRVEVWFQDLASSRRALRFEVPAIATRR